ncbi:MAG: hypothetical protein M3411_07255 [Chloroflexota bacterium]|nr:hypothetical protein [Chloroflexota bacterium]
MPKRQLYEGLPSSPRRPAPFKNVVYQREAVARATIEAFAPHLVIVDHAPAGLFGEIAAALDTLDRSRPRPAFIFLMRDITFGAKQTRDLWRPERAFDFLDRVYDRILVYGSRELYDPIEEYQISPTAAAKTRFCGYLRPPAPTRTSAEIRHELGASDRPLIVVTVGGGADGGAIVRAYLSALSHGPPDDLVSFIVSGPLLDHAERDAITELADRHPNVTLRTFHPDLISYLHAADLIVTMGGYNAMVESVVTGKPTLVIPRKPGSEEQLIRGERFAERGFVDLLPPRELTPHRLGEAIVTGLQRGERPPRSLPLDGREAIMDELMGILNHRFPLALDSG